MILTDIIVMVLILAALLLVCSTVIILENKEKSEKWSNIYKGDGRDD